MLETTIQLCDGILQCLPRSFARSNGLDKMSGEKIVLLNEEGRSWKLNLTYYKTGIHTYVRPGWKRFCAANKMSKGQQYTLKLVRKSGPPLMRLYLKNKKKKYGSRCRASSSDSQKRFVTLTLTPAAFYTYKLVSFVQQLCLEEGIHYYFSSKNQIFCAVSSE